MKLSHAIKVSLSLCSILVVLVLFITVSVNPTDFRGNLREGNPVHTTNTRPVEAGPPTSSTPPSSTKEGVSNGETAVSNNEAVGVASTTSGYVSMDRTMSMDRTNLKDPVASRAVVEPVNGPLDVTSTTYGLTSNGEAVIDPADVVNGMIHETASIFTGEVIPPVSSVVGTSGSENLTGGCEIPEGGFKAWSKGVVSTVAPDVPVSCSKVFTGDKDEVDRVKEAMEKWVNAVSNEDFTRDVRNCSWLQESFSSNMYNSKLEKGFPIAFTFVVYDSPQQVLRLMRLLYRPQNVYCIHPDLKSPYRAVFESIAECFDNVIIPSELEKVGWGDYTILAAQMNCMWDLLKYRWKRTANKWQYVINLCGKELSLVTNREMVSRLLKLNGTSSLLIIPSGAKKGMVARLRGERPFNLSSYYKSSSYNALSYNFANFIAYDSKAKKYYEFFKQCRNPEEHFYATLYMQPDVPGGYDKRLKDNYFAVSAAYWTYLKETKCQGKAIHSVCVVNAGDMSSVVRESRFFFNKYFMDLDHTVMTCMEGRIVERNKLEYQEECGTV